ncbi:protein translocase subunit SecDF [Flavobacterium suncheonense]|uniref:Multifunctional fusion protein n=1 Tax=Flavobacterium suncheonense GH29-5 = DSM 17707 TaxID=1121899 RepID=A0A0A2MP67_9FLAO|nr:protein translocase subunit SecDF [Flavobacterium suncheonense]KGO90070.1 preprotein translocase subunit SecD [Flavobacterium suncheonense GH29-5 = DSM 17707]
MQNKGLIKFFAILFALVSIYQLSFTVVTNNIESKAKAASGGDSKKELAYLDSIGREKVFLGHTFNEVREKQINKGLDLEGGINVTLQISVKDVLKGLANNSKNPVFNQALSEATKNREGNQDYLDAFFIAFDKVSNGTTKLSSPEIFANRNLTEITSKMTDAQVKPIIKQKVKESVESAFNVLRERIDKFGVTQPNIQKIGESGRILVELPGAKDVDRITKLLQSTAQLEFWQTYKMEEIGSFLLAANDALKKTEKPVAVKEAPKTSQIDSLLTGSTAKDTTTAAAAANNPLLGLVKGGGQQGGPVLAYFSPKDTAKVNSYLKREDIRALLPAEQRFARFAWGKVNPKTPDVVELFALKTTRDGVPPVGGGVVTNAKDDFNQLGKPCVTIQFNAAGARKWEDFTGEVAKTVGFIAIVLDNTVHSAPRVEKPIPGGSCEISGSFEISETKDLANILRAGKLPASAEIVQKEVVGPSLGQQAIDNGIMSSLVGLALVCLWMVFYYGRAGWYANVALIVNLLFLFGILASLGAVLTLPGIAGIVLTMGTAVDANIIIYERAKEELRHGKSLADSVVASYSWHGAMRSIIDANVTHILTGLILFIFGTGPIKGFATTLLIGIFTSLFTAIFIARIFIDRDIAAGRSLMFATNITKNWFTNFHFDFLKAKKWTYMISSLVVIVSCVSFFVNGLDQGVDFVGGRTFQVKFEKPVVPSEISEELSKEFGVNVEVKEFGNSSQMRIITKYKVLEDGVGVDKEVNEKLYNGLKKHYTASNISYEDFINTAEGKTLGVVSSSKVSATVSDDIKTNSFWAVIGAMLVVGLYLAVSFRKWQYSLGAIAAVAHDVIFVLGTYSLLYKYMPFHMEMDQHFIAAILTVIGYSMNDTVIVFDRIREFIAGNTKGDFNKIVNDSVNTTLSRTINTSLTMIIVLLIMFIFGGESIRGFIFAMLIGIAVGTYSSLFLATPVLVDSMPKSDKDEVERLHEEANA